MFGVRDATMARRLGHRRQPYLDELQLCHLVASIDAIDWTPTPPTPPTPVAPPRRRRGDVEADALRRLAAAVDGTARFLLSHQPVQTTWRWSGHTTAVFCFLLYPK